MKESPEEQVFKRFELIEVVVSDPHTRSFPSWTALLELDRAKLEVTDILKLYTLLKPSQGTLCLAGSVSVF
jgi:hypothetical protein